MKGKREIAARLCAATGFTSLLEHLRKRPSLIVLAYHRIGNGNGTLYDPGVFSATGNEFQWHIAYLRRHFEICKLGEAVAMVRGEQALRSCVLVTFDDGYRDNYEVAFPILRASGVPATFFLPTAFIGSDRLPWWDEVAFIVKNARRKCFEISYPYLAEFDAEKLGQHSAIVEVLRAYKHPSMKNHERFISELAAAAESELPAKASESSFMSWQQAREMCAGGMEFGSHTHRHEVLSKLSIQEQFEELQCSREILERELRQPITTLSYPVGGRATFSRETQEMAKHSGYKAAFSFYGGFNDRNTLAPYDIRRVGVEQQSHPRLRLQMAIAAVSGATWV